MARIETKVFEHGNTIRVHCQVVIDEGEGDIVDIPDGSKEAPIGIVRIEYNVNTSGEPVWEELKKHTNVGRIMENVKGHLSVIAELERKVEDYQRQLALFDELGMKPRGL